MDINITETAEALKISVTGDVELLSIAMSKNKLMKEVRVANKDIELDLAKVNYMDSSGIGLLMSLLKLQEEKGKTLKLINVNKGVRKILSSCSIDNIFNL